MPKIVDHDQRRTEIAELAVRAVAEHGLDGVQLRHVADLAGCTTGALMHFYPTKRAVLEAALEHVTQALVGRCEASTGTDIGADLAELLPVDAARRREWRVWVSYMGTAGFKSHLRRVNHVFYERWGIWARNLVAHAAERGEVRSNLDFDAVADQIIAVLDGIGVRATLDPRAWPAAHQIEVVRGYVKLLTK